VKDGPTEEYSPPSWPSPSSHRHKGRPPNAITSFAYYGWPHVQNRPPSFIDRDPNCPHNSDTSPLSPCSVTSTLRRTENEKAHSRAGSGTSGQSSDEPLPPARRSSPLLSSRLFPFLLTVPLYRAASSNDLRGDAHLIITFPPPFRTPPSF